MNYDVSIVRCDNYEPEVCRAALEQALAPIGGLDWVKPEMRIAIKVNLVSAMKPEEAATTHPALLCALIALLRERGASVVLGDSPGGLYTAAHLTRVYEATGMRACEAAGCELNQDFSQREAAYPQAAAAKHFTYTAWLDGADAIIDFCKLKTHGMMGMTCAVKNYFGVVPGTMKPEYHYKYPKTEDFANMLVDLCEYFKPRLCICDAVVGMEGNGPTKGTPRKIGCILAAPNAHNLDLVAAGLIGLSPDEIPTLMAARARGLVPATAQELNVFGSAEPFVQSDFKTIPSQASAFFRSGGKGVFGKIADSVMFHSLTPRPKLAPRECVGCKKCANICPAKAITMKNGKPQIDRNACIHCFCCQEFCPKGAMKVYRPLVARVLNR